MVRKNNPADQPVDFDDLLNEQVTPGIDQDQPDAPEIPVEPWEDPDEIEPVAEDVSETEETLTADQLRIRALEAELSKPLPAAVTRPVEDIQKTPDQLRIEELEQKLAERNAVVLERRSETYLRPANPEGAQLIHFIEDGFTDLGGVWLRGQEIYIDEAVRATTLDRFGNTWLDDLSIEAQYRRWGKQYIGIGKFVPRPGEVFDDDVAREDVRRKGAIPVLAE